MSLIREGADNIPPQAFVSWKDPQGNLLASINRDGTIFSATGLIAPDNTASIDVINSQSVPIVRGSITMLAQTQPLLIGGELEPEALLHQMNVYVNSHLDGGGLPGDNTLEIFLTWTDLSGETIKSLIGSIDGVSLGATNLNFTEPVLPAVGTPIIVTTAYGGTVQNNHFTYDISVCKLRFPLDSYTVPFSVTTNNTGAPTPAVIGKVRAVIQATESKKGSIDVVTPLSSVVLVSGLYNVTLYYFPSDTSGSALQWWHPVITWTSPSGLSLTSVTALGLGPCGNGDPNYGQAYAIPLLCKGGTPIVITGFYTVNGYPNYDGGPCTPFPIDLSISVVAMPGTEVS